MADTIKCIPAIVGSNKIERAIMNTDQAHTAVERARVTKKAWAARSLAERTSLVRPGVELIGKMIDEIVPKLAWQTVRPVRYGGEFDSFNASASYIAVNAPAPIQQEDSDDFKRYSAPEPHWRVLVVAPTLIAGNAVILKHASQASLAGECIAQAFCPADTPEDVFTIVFLSHELTSDMIAQASFGFVNFTDSVGGGRAIERVVAGTFTADGLEQGSKDPGYVMEDADFDVAAETLIDGAMFSLHQCCCGIEQISVSESLFDAFVEKAVKIVSGYVLGNPLDQSTTRGPKAQVRFADEVRAQTQEAAGAQAPIDPALSARDGGVCLMPQILVNVDHSMRVRREESSGPVVGIMAVKDDSEALELMNASEFGLTASLWTQDIAGAERIGQALETGAVFMNRADCLDPSASCIGGKNIGRGGGFRCSAITTLRGPNPII